MVAIGYGVPSKLNMTQLGEIAGDNVIKVSKPRRIKRMVKKIKKMVCSKYRNHEGGKVTSLPSLHFLSKLLSLNVAIEHT